MNLKNIATACLICSIISNSCTQNQQAKVSEAQAIERLKLPPRTLVIDEITCRQCVKDMAEAYSGNQDFAKVLFLTADAFGETTLKMENQITLYSRREYIQTTGTSPRGSYLIDAKGEVHLLDAKNYKKVLDEFLKDSTQAVSRN